MAILSALATTIEGASVDLILYGPLVVLQAAAFCGVAYYEGRRRARFNDSAYRIRCRNNNHRRRMAIEKNRDK